MTSDAGVLLQRAEFNVLKTSPKYLQTLISAHNTTTSCLPISRIIFKLFLLKVFPSEHFNMILFDGQFGNHITDKTLVSASLLETTSQFSIFNDQLHPSFVEENSLKLN